MKLVVGILTLCLVAFNVFAGPSRSIGGLPRPVGGPTRPVGDDEDEPKSKVVSVIDGNTVQILDPKGEQYKLILYGIDSPDSGQNFALEATKALAALVLNKEVILIFHGKDRHGNLLGEVKPDNETDVKVELLLAGLAWTTELNEELESVKQHARARGVGLWADENPTPPWLWRRQQSMLRSKSN